MSVSNIIDNTGNISDRFMKKIKDKLLAVDEAIYILNEVLQIEDYQYNGTYQGISVNQAVNELNNPVNNNIYGDNIISSFLATLKTRLENIEQSLLNVETGGSSTIVSDLQNDISTINENLSNITTLLSQKLETSSLIPLIDSIESKANSSVIQNLQTQINTAINTVAAFQQEITLLNADFDALTSGISTVDYVNTKVSELRTIVDDKANIITVNNINTTLSNAINEKANNTTINTLTERINSLESLTTSNGSSITTLNNDIITINNTLANKAESSSVSSLSTTINALPTKTYVDNALASKADSSSVSSLSTTINALPTKTYVDNALASKADSTTVSTLSTTISGKADKTYVDNAIASKADSTTVTTLSTTISGKADKIYVDNALTSKADSTTVSTLSTAINAKADKTSFDNLSLTVNALPTKAYVDSLVIPLPPYYEYTTGSGFVCTPSYTIFTDIALTNFPVFNTSKYQMIMNFCFFPNYTSTLNQIIEVYFKIVLPNNTESTDSQTVSPYNSNLLPACLRTADFYSTVSSGVGIPANAIFYKPTAYLMKNLKLRTYMRIRNATNVAFPSVSMTVSFIPVLTY